MRQQSGLMADNRCKAGNGIVRTMREDLSDAEMLAAFRTGLHRTREHLLNALLEAHPGGSHGEMCYNLHAGGALLMGIFDGIALRAEKCPFDHRIGALLAVQERSLNRCIPGATMDSIRRDIVSGFEPWNVHAEEGDDDTWDMCLTTGSAPLLRGLMFPLFNDAVEALAALYVLVGLEDVAPIHAL